MSERGVFAVDRGIWEHDLLADSEPFSRREAWLWLLSEAAWKPHRRRIIGRLIELERGQLVASSRFIASKWRWSEARVRRFLTALISERMVDAKTDAGVNVITICKYDEYQRVSLPSDAMRKTDDDAGATQERRKVEDKETKEDKAEEDITPLPAIVPVPARADGWPADFREQFWTAYPRKLEKKAALAVLERIRKGGAVPWVKLIGAVSAYAATADPQFTKHPTTWLNKGCWDDEPDIPTFLDRRKPQQQSGILDAADRAIQNLLEREREAADRGSGIGGPPPFRLISQG